MSSRVHKYVARERNNHLNNKGKTSLQADIYSDSGRQPTNSFIFLFTVRYIPGIYFISFLAEQSLVLAMKAWTGDHLALLCFVGTTSRPWQEDPCSACTWDISTNYTPMLAPRNWDREISATEDGRRMKHWRGSHTYPDLNSAISQCRHSSVRSSVGPSQIPPSLASGPWPPLAPVRGAAGLWLSRASSSRPGVHNAPLAPWGNPWDGHEIQRQVSHTVGRDLYNVIDVHHGAILNYLTTPSRGGREVEFELAICTSCPPDQGLLWSKLSAERVCMGWVKPWSW